MPPRVQPLLVRLSRPELAAELSAALARADCLCTGVSHGTMLVLHREAADEAEARTELGFFLRAWAGGRGLVAEVI